VGQCLSCEADIQSNGLDNARLHNAIGILLNLTRGEEVIMKRCLPVIELQICYHIMTLFLHIEYGICSFVLLSDFW
jgi:hypothetical protein